MSLARWTSQIKNARWTWDDTVSLGQLKHLRTLLNEIIPSKTWTLYGTSLLFNNQTNASLGLDGYDNYQAPQENGKQLFDRRMWVSGSLKFWNTPRIGESLRCVERVQLVRRVGDSVFVAVLRETRKLDFDSEVEGGSVKVGNERTGDVIVSELRSLVYKWRADVSEKPNSETSENIETSSPVASKEPDPDASTELTISASQVSRFSALQYNLHKIHYNRDYCLSEGLSDVIVLGPMLVNIMLHYLALRYPKAVIELFSYRMSEPCYVDRPLRISMENGEKSVEIAVWEGSKKLCNGTARRPSS
ncbi:hypothetical protein C7M61_002671 [Candidozyma pseudohaemuli]|uniref:MaoC-like domain-containing protein n=1 Tax=Candidozyma pseudohaemuli TaxID=418784 RepID=A0A2P7YRZ2_9ASCO|nr:hypothetical protein C7M61_002671 [[Candida] pseudohaemulonii]PSK38732.1 hypothetical protein C7M61_002671 [[Candida] pseudohaemulonii]